MILRKALATRYWTKPHQRFWTDTFLNWAFVHHPEPSEERTLADLAAVQRTEHRKLTSRIDNVPGYAVAQAKTWTPGSWPKEHMDLARLVYEDVEREIVAQGAAPEGVENFVIGGSHA